MDGMCKCINVIRGAHNLMHKQRNLNDSTQPLWLGEETKKWFSNWRDKKVSITLYFLRSTLYLHLLAKKRILAVRQLAVFRAERKKICELR